MRYQRTLINLPRIVPQQLPGGVTCVESSGLYGQLKSYVLAFAQAAANGSNNARHALALQAAAIKQYDQISGRMHVTELINISVPYTQPRVVLIDRLKSRRKPWPKKFPARFWMGHVDAEGLVTQYYWVGQFRTPAGFDPEHLGSIDFNTTVMLEVSDADRTVRLSIRGRNENSVYRRMAAAFGGDEDVPCGYQVARELKQPPEQYLWMTAQNA